MIEILAQLVMTDMDLIKSFAETVLIKIVLCVLNNILLALSVKTNTVSTTKKIASVVGMNSVKIVMKIIKFVLLAKKIMVSILITTV